MKKLFPLFVSIITLPGFFLAQPLDFIPFNSAPCDNVVMHFDGMGDYIQPANSPLQGSGDFTVEAWFFNQDNDGNGNNCSGNFERIIACGGDRFEIGTCGINLAIVVNNASASIPGVTVNNNQWYHVAATRSGSEIKLYLNCVEVYSTTNSFTLSNTFRVGRWPGGPTGDNELWKGFIDEVRAWDYARTPSEIEAYKNCELTGMEPGLELYYNFSEGIPEGDNTGILAATDVSQNGNDGTLNGFALTGTVSNYVCDDLTLCVACFADFDFDLINFCGGYQFINTSFGDNLNYCWDFNNDPGTCESTDVNPTYSFPASGVYNVCLTINNPDGCERTYCEEIEVAFDDSPPQIVCPPSQVIPCEEQPGNIEPDISNSPCATFLDVVCVRDDGLELTDPYPPCQSVTITCSATNDFGGTICQFDISTEDDIPPTAVCLSNLTVLMEDCAATISPNDIDDLSFDNCAIVSKSLDISVFGPDDACQFVDVTLTVTDCSGSTDQCVTTVFLEDTTVPTITCPDNIQVDCDIDPSNTGYPTGEAPCPGLLNYDYLDDTLGLFPCDAILTRTWIASDACGNMTTCEQTILVADQTPPVIICPPNITVNQYDDPNPPATGVATATDNCAVDIDVTYNDFVDNPDPCPNGQIISRTWIAEDECGNIDQCLQLINVLCADTCALDTFFIRTGYDYANDQPLTGNNTPDPYWTINGQPMVTTGHSSYSTLPGTRYVRANPAGIFSSWNADFSFCLPDEPFDCTELTMMLNIRVDNRVTGVMLNGNPLLANWGATVNNFNNAPFSFTWNPVALECSYFNTGTNVLTFTFQNFQGPSGLDVGGFITFDPTSISTPFDIDCCAPAPVCPCDNLQADADLGILGPKFGTYECYGSFRPAGLTDCDSISWTVDNNYVGSTSGTFEWQGADLQTSFSTKICMEVFRTQPNGVTCGPLIVCKDITVNCMSPVEEYPDYPDCNTDYISNPALELETEEGLLSEIGNFGGWEVAFGEPYVKTGPGFGDKGYLLLLGNGIESDGVMQKLDLTPGKQYGMLSALHFGDWNFSQNNTQVIVRLSNNPQLGTINEGDVEEIVISCCISDTVPTISFFIPENWENEVYLTIHVENDQEVVDDAGASKSLIDLDNFCIVGVVSAVDERGFGHSVQLFPNPTAGELNVLLENPTSERLTLTVGDLWGRRLSQTTMPAGQNLQTLSVQDLPSAVYLLTITDAAGNTWHSKFVKQ